MVERQIVSVKDLEDVDFDKIQNCEWASKLWEDVEKMTKKAFLHWCLVVKNVAGSDSDCIAAWKKSFVDGVDELYTDILLDIQSVEESAKRKIQEHLVQFESVCKDLQQPMPATLGAQGLCLYEELGNLKKELSKMEAVKIKRVKQVEALLKKQKSLCKQLAKLEKPLQVSPLPSDQEIHIFEEYLDTLEHDIFERTEKFISLKTELVQIATELRYKPRNDFEKQILLDDIGQLSDEIMEQSAYFFTYLKEIQKEIKDKIEKLRQKVEQLWELLDVDLISRATFRTENEGVNMDTLHALEEELKRCDASRKANLQNFIEKIREELVRHWTKCHCEYNEMIRQFKPFRDDLFTEDLLELHDLELQKWNRYYEENGHILRVIDTHNKLWLRMLDLEDKTSQPDRFKNRGGQLLQEEKERNALAKQIPKLEDEMRALAEEYYETHGTRFKTFGLTIEEHIGKLHFERENNRKLKLSARKMQREATPAKTPKNRTQLFVSTRKATPLSKSKASPKKLTCKALTLPSQKRRSRSSINSPKRSVKNATTKAKKLDLPTLKITDELNATIHNDDPNYALFQMDLCNNASRSTIVPKTPTQTSRVLRTPSSKTSSRIYRGTPTSTSQSAKRIGNKITACRTNTKLIF